MLRLIFPFQATKYSFLRNVFKFIFFYMRKMENRIQRKYIGNSDWSFFIWMNFVSLPLMASKQAVKDLFRKALVKVEFLPYDALTVTWRTWKKLFLFDKIHFYEKAYVTLLLHEWRGTEQLDGKGTVFWWLCKSKISKREI